MDRLLVARCFYLHNGQIEEQTQKVSGRSGKFPRTVEFQIDDINNDEIRVRQKFDPRKDWDAWVSGKKVFITEIRCHLFSTLGLVYMDENLYSYAAKEFGIDTKPTPAEIMNDTERMEWDPFISVR